MVAIKTGSLYDGTTLDCVVPNFYANVEETYGIPLYSVHRVDLHNQLRSLATQQDGPGHPCEIQVRAKVHDYVSSGISWVNFRLSYLYAPGCRSRKDLSCRQ